MYIPALIQTFHISIFATNSLCEFTAGAVSRGVQVPLCRNQGGTRHPPDNPRQHFCPCKKNVIGLIDALGLKQNIEFHNDVDPLISRSK